MGRTWFTWGGDGFSKYDLYYNVLGIGTAVLIDKIWKPKEDSKWERGFSITALPFTIGWIDNNTNLSLSRHHSSSG